VTGWREMPIVEIDANNLVHVQLQPHLHKPPGAIDTWYLLASVHLRGGLVEHIMYTP
jgi:cytochrome c-type biogenesis protein CcmH/NrfG